MLARLPDVRRPSLRRRIASALALMTVDGFLVIGAGVSAVRNLSTPGYYQHCSGVNVVAELPIQETCTYTGPQITLSLLLLAALAALTVWGWWRLAGWALQPLGAAADTVDRLGPQNLGQRIRLGGGADEFKRLADALDDALDRLAAGYESQRRFAADASHELRTPLAVQRLLTEVALEAPETGDDLRKLGAQLLRVNERSEDLIEGLLVLVESDRGLVGKVPVRLDELAAAVLDEYQDLAEEHEVTLRRKLAAAVAPGDPVLLERMIANLVSNAVKYNVPGGWVEVELTAESAGPVLAVRNTGERVPGEAVATLFEPFRRLGTDRVRGRGGAGLGLAIVRSIALAHRASVQVRPRVDGGLELEVRLPAGRVS